MRSFFERFFGSPQPVDPDSELSTALRESATSFQKETQQRNARDHTALEAALIASQNSQKLEETLEFIMRSNSIPALEQLALRLNPPPPQIKAVVAAAAVVVEQQPPRRLSEEEEFEKAIAESMAMEEKIRKDKEKSEKKIFSGVLNGHPISFQQKIVPGDGDCGLHALGDHIDRRTICAVLRSAIKEDHLQESLCLEIEDFLNNDVRRLQEKTPTLQNLLAIWNMLSAEIALTVQKEQCFRILKEKEEAKNPKDRERIDAIQRHIDKTKKLQEEYTDQKAMFCKNPEMLSIYLDALEKPRSIFLGVATLSEYARLTKTNLAIWGEGKDDRSLREIGGYSQPNQPVMHIFLSRDHYNSLTPMSSPLIANSFLGHTEGAPAAASPVAAEAPQRRLT